MGERILLLQTSWLGDVVLSTPVISALKKIYPHSFLATLTTPLAKPLVQYNPNVDLALTYDKNGEECSFISLVKKSRELRKLNFNIAFALQRSARSALLVYLSGIKLRVGFADSSLGWLYNRQAKRPVDKHDVLRNLAIIEPISQDEQNAELCLEFPKNFSLSPELLKLLESEQINLKEKKHYTLAPTSAWKTKQWSTDEYRRLAKQLTSRGSKIIVIGALSEYDICQKVTQDLPTLNLAGKTTLLESAYLIKHSKALVSNDSLATHIASAFKTPNVVIFCATSPAFGFGPWRNHAIIVEKEGLSCKPCSRHGGKYCPTGTESCMKEVYAEQVLAALDQLNLNL
ncbi:MAG TPA: lipopolysaccharide heptosyltransferase II [Oligoflexia bacterium]|nr:lipopolysaccharide heptosyltransferase II [Oligoflexia bacterium]HMP27656.1 lipopolysaccharide heptosyltransferase II [Oligoflexia bacterium]